MSPSVVSQRFLNQLSACRSRLTANEDVPAVLHREPVGQDLFGTRLAKRKRVGIHLPGVFELEPVRIRSPSEFLRR